MAHVSSTSSTSTPAPAIPLDLAYTYLDRAQQLISQPNGWVQSCLAVDSNHQLCSPESDLAVAYCELGAIQAATHYDPTDPAKANKFCVSIFQMANPNTVARGSVPALNDGLPPSTGQQTVIKMFERAKALLIKFGAQVN